MVSGVDVTASTNHDIGAGPLTRHGGDPATDRVLDAAKRCCERWGIAKVTVDDIAAEAKISRATLYRMFPGGKDVLYDALRERDLRDFLVELDSHLAGATSFADLVVRVVTNATRQLRGDEHLQLMLASEPGQVAHELSVSQLPQIITLATVMIGPRVEAYVDVARAGELAEYLSRVVLSYFLTPSARVDLADEDSAAEFVRRFVLPAFPIT